MAEAAQSHVCDTFACGQAADHERSQLSFHLNVQASQYLKIMGFQIGL